MTDPMTDMVIDMMTEDTGVTDMTADIEVMMTDHMTDTDIEADTMMGEQERILVEGL